MAITAHVTAVGDKAFSEEAALMILFGEGATEKLREISVIQKFDRKQTQQKLALHAGDQVKFDDQVYTILRVGKLANDNLRTIGHAAISFEAAASGLENALDLTPALRPKIHVGTAIVYG